MHSWLAQRHTSPFDAGAAGAVQVVQHTWGESVAHMGAPFDVVVACGEWLSPGKGAAPALSSVSAGSIRAVGPLLGWWLQLILTSPGIGR